MEDSLKRLDLSYVDVVFAHRHDASTPMEEIVRGFNAIIEKGQAFYWFVHHCSYYLHEVLTL